MPMPILIALLKRYHYFNVVAYKCIQHSDEAKFLMLLKMFKKYINKRKHEFILFFFSHGYSFNKYVKLSLMERAVNYRGRFTPSIYQEVATPIQNENASSSCAQVIVSIFVLFREIYIKYSISLEAETETDEKKHAKSTCDNEQTCQNFLENFL